MPVSFYFYLLKSPSNRYKIGITRNLKTRLRSYKTHSSEPLEVFLSFEIVGNEKDARQLEKAFKDTFKDKHLQGEWFALNSGDIKQIQEVANEHETNLDY